MGKMIEQFKHAFAIGPEPGRADEVRELPKILERIARGVVDRGMETPAVIALESVIPLNFLGSQVMYAVWPLVKMVADGVDYQDVAAALEDRETLRGLVMRIEELSTGNRGLALTLDT
jgi:phosphoribosyl-ATP pyrophosphohydrolase